MIICLDIGGSTIKAARAEGPEGALVHMGRHATPLDDFEAFSGLLARICRDSGAAADDPLSISITGVIAPETGIMTCANIPCIDGRTLAGDLAERLGRPVLISNDADCFALAEAHRGAGRGKRIVFGAILGTGIGGGLVIDGRAIMGAGGIAGEWGHGPVAATDTPFGPAPRFACGCGLAGCVDTVGGARGIERLYSHLHGESRDSRAITAAWREGDTKARQVMDMHLSLVAPPLALVVNIVGADIVPVGGGLANVPGLVERIDAEVRKLILRRSENPIVVPSHMGDNAGLVGAAIVGQTSLSAS